MPSRPQVPAPRQGRVRGRACALLGLLGLAVMTAGCGSAQAAPAAEVAADFYRAVAAGEGAAACDLLAPTTAQELASTSGRVCAEAIVDQELEATAQAPTRVSVFGTMAEVRAAGQTTFLNRYPTGWRVLAAGCQAQANQPYECQVKGG